MRLLTDPYPLRCATDLEHYRADHAERYLPVVLGRAHVRALPLDAQGRDWLVADHAVTAIESLSDADGKPLAFERIHTSLRGRTVALARLAQPMANGEVMARVAGLADAQSGSLIETPGAVLRTIFARAGFDVAPDDYADLDDALPGVPLSLVIDEPLPVRELASRVTQALGAAWAPGIARLARPAARAAWRLGEREIEQISARASLTALHTTARVSYARDHASGSARGALTLTVPEQAGRLPERIVDIDLGLIPSARAAATVAQLRAEDALRAWWEIELDVGLQHAHIALLDTVEITHGHAPTGRALVMARTLDRRQGRVSLSCRMPAEEPPRIETVGAASAIDAQPPTGSGVLYRDGMATFNVVDDQGRPLAGAAVTLDGVDTANTNARGQVAFRTTRGAHTLLVNASGYAPFEMGVTV